MATRGEELNKAMNENANALWSYKMGEHRASLLKPADLSRSGLDLGQYYEGYAAELDRIVESGSISPEAKEELLATFPQPEGKEEDPTAGQVAMAFVLPPKEQWSPSFRNGYEEARDLIKKRGRSDFPREGASWAEYELGYQHGINQKLSEGAISHNQARWCMGVLDEVHPIQPEFDAVKIPQHYNTGQIEVANFIADQELAYPADNIIKYVVRAGKKDPAKKLEDIEKAAAYLQMMHNLANGLPAVVRDPETREVVWSLFKN